MAAESQEEFSEFDAHDRAMNLPMRDVVRALVDVLGLTMVAAIGGVAETRAVQHWMVDREPQRPNTLRFALQLALTIEARRSMDTTRAWFYGSNPRLGDATPIQMLRDRSLGEIQAPLAQAARSFANHPEHNR